MLKIGSKVKDYAGVEGIVTNIVIGHSTSDHGSIEIEVTNPGKCKWLKAGDKEHYVYFQWEKALNVEKENT